MTTNLFILPYRAGSTSASVLAQGLEAKLIRLKNSKFKGSAGKTVINWGNTTPSNADEIARCNILNPPELITQASNKLQFFQACADAGEEGPPIPRFTREKGTAAGWFDESKKAMVLARTVLAGNSGEGIVKIESKEELSKVPDNTLLVEYKLKRDEFRVHVARGIGAFCIQQKRARYDFEGEIDYKVRNYDNGFVFAREEVSCPTSVTESAIRALQVTGLDFGAVDVIYNARYEQPYVLEVNTAPGIEASTVQDYIGMFNKLLKVA